MFQADSLIVIIVLYRIARYEIRGCYKEPGFDSLWFRNGGIEFDRELRLYDGREEQLEDHFVFQKLSITVLRGSYSIQLRRLVSIMWLLRNRVPEKYMSYIKKLHRHTSGQVKAYRYPLLSPMEWQGFQLCHSVFYRTPRLGFWTVELSYSLQGAEILP